MTNDPRDLKITMKPADETSAEEVQRRVNVAFDILFNELAKQDYSE